MAVEFNHTIVHARDKHASAEFLAVILGVPAPVPFGPFLAVELSNGVTLDFMETVDVVLTEHYAFLVSEADFDQIFARIRARNMPYWADPGQNKPGEINTHDGGRGVYFDDPSGHQLEIITRPYGEARG